MIRHAVWGNPACEGGKMATHLSAVQAPVKDMTMPLGEKIRQLRSERGWSQGELAARLGGDPGQISRYETGKISPSVDVVVKLAEAFDVSADYLLIDGAARRPLRAPADLLGERLAQLDQLTPDDRAALIHILDHMLANNRARAALTPHAS
jgi:transcriptional regulator with XRE-family HTH domain